MRFDFSIPQAFIVQIRELIAIVILAYLGSLLYFGSYRGMWRYAGIADMLSILKAVSLGTALLIVGAGGMAGEREA